ncbi:MAG TPA: T9SS type A sorting domain-containing protein [Bacteroidales bacterium]|nr:T9SS type A sorting domain-containing protein [Bacteroidales bacterium]HPF02668.1 T9SS type A sorting domain-containing protein [Bacteroidales bacterium]HPJ60505.1 T9SS type A sorting domain-containing protein [Bacteroidales bacterium]HPR13426.1 T9SS type A sorting domain-containing protein [Bacteroidales bacterium]HRW84975.1 T9SS type A sorting domain-containing protein [Bacteroidales bacterium]
MIKKILLNIILFVPAINIICGQETVTGLQTNRQIIDRLEKRITGKGVSSENLVLPFFDDFSKNGIFPDSSKWTDNFVFINNAYTSDQITTGVATFDAIDDKGRLYETASGFIFEADHLSSQPIDLEFNPSDSIRLSFFFQSGGLGDAPEENDTLVVQFYAPASNRWFTAWKSTGGSDSQFRPVILRVEDPKFLQKGFRFRFINHASLSSNLSEPSMAGNCDHWNIDYVILDRFRNDGDTLFRDVAFRFPNRSLLSSHEAMPWQQFLKVALNEMAPSVPMHYRNNDGIVRNVTRNFDILDMYTGTTVYSFVPTAANVDPYTDVDYNATLIYTFAGSSNDSALFRIKSWLITDNFDPKSNDTVVYYQYFGNYFAFDDGSAEGGYGINGLGSRNAMVAYRFKSFIQDTLRAVSVCFNDSYLNANQRAFDIMVWDDNAGIPGNVIYSQEEEMVEQGENINGFFTYRLRESIMVDDVFYVGWKQRSETFLNAGLDINTPHNGRQFYWINGNWIQSGVQGTLMIRPVMGPPVATSVNDIRYPGQQTLRFRPNPARDYIMIDLGEIPDPEKVFISVIDLNGRTVLKVHFSERTDVSSLKAGMYFIVADRNGTSLGINRLIITR